MHFLVIVIFGLALSGCIPAGDDLSRSAPPPRLPTDLTVLGPSGDSPPAPSTWQARPVKADAKSVEDGVYVVQPGDTLRGIANKTGAGSQVIAAINGLTEPYIIRPGQELIIRGGRYHRVGAGETGIAIARAYAVPWRDVVELNGLEEPYILRVGQRLLLPGSASAAASPPTIEQRAASFELDIDDIVTGGQPALASNAAAPSEWRQAVKAETPIAAPRTFAGQFLWPVDGKIVSRFGSKGGGRRNDGINIAVPRGTPIRSAGDGVVAYAGDEIGVFGGLILINHGSGWVTAYGHAEKLNVARGQKVRAGETIGLAGESGYVQEPQLHFEIRRNRKPVDPANHLPSRA